MISEIITLLASTFYSHRYQIILKCSATTGLVVLFSFISYFAFDPYLGSNFLHAVVASSTNRDTYTGVLLGMPGANSLPPLLCVDAHPLAQQVESNYYALTRQPVITSTINGLLSGTLTFGVITLGYIQLVMYFGIPEMWDVSLF